MWFSFSTRFNSLKQIDKRNSMHTFTRCTPRFSGWYTRMINIELGDYQMKVTWLRPANTDTRMFVIRRDSCVSVYHLHEDCLVDKPCCNPSLRIYLSSNLTYESCANTHRDSLTVNKKQAHPTVRTVIQQKWSSFMIKILNYSGLIYTF